MDDTISQNVGQKYQLLERIGTGGMAEVYRSRMFGAMGFEKQVVIKKLLPQLAAHPEMVAQFIGEARLAALLQHENIACVYDFGEMDGSYFIAMEYLFGKDLHTVMQRVAETGGRIDLQIALVIALKLCKGMDYAHSLQDMQQRPLHIIHRDLSPHNVFITYDGKVKIIDFGIARAELFDNRTRVGTIKGKISYMSPEQLTAETIDKRSDIFSIGILLYEMLSGKRMYSGDTATLIRKCMQVEYDKLQVLLPDLPPAIFNILDKALALDKTVRYASCAEMRADIEECLYGRVGRPSADILQQYIQQLFSPEYTEEKKGFLEESEKVGGQWLANAKGVTDSEKDTPTDLVLPQQTQVYDRQEVSPPEQSFLPFRRWMMVLMTVGICCIIGFAVFRNGDGNMPGQGGSGTTLQQAEKNVPASEGQKNGVEEMPVAAEAAGGTTSPPLEIQPEGDRTVVKQADNSDNEVPAVLAETEQVKGDKRPKKQVPATEARLAEQKKEAIRILAGKAEAALQKNQLTTPEGDCAHKYYSEILQLDGHNALALAGMQKIADRYAVLAEESYRNLNIAQCREYVRQGLAIAPQHRQLLQLRRDLTRSKPGMFFKSLEKSFKPIFQ